MPENKTQPTPASVTDFINAVEDENKRQDSFRLVEIITNLTGLEPKMWGASIIGFGNYHYKYTSGHEGEAPLVGFSPRKNALTLYLTAEAATREKLLNQLGKHKSGKGCLYINKLSEVNPDILKELIKNSITNIQSLYPFPN